MNKDYEKMLVYYRERLTDWLQQEHFEQAGDEEFIEARAEAAAKEYMESLKYNSGAASEYANQTLFAGLWHSFYSFVDSVMSSLEKGGKMLCDVLSQEEIYQESIGSDLAEIREKYGQAIAAGLVDETDEAERQALAILKAKYNCKNIYDPFPEEREPDEEY